MSFAENVRQTARDKGITQKELAQRTGIPQGTLETYLRHENPCHAPVENAVRLAHILGTTVEALVSGQDSRQLRVGKALMQSIEEQLIKDVEKAIRGRIDSLGSGR
jgi:transcriptional regulator with XRE-family HTH domain